MTNFFLREQNYGILSRVINFILIFCQKNFILITTSIVVRNIIFVFNLYVEKFQRPTLKKNPGSATGFGTSFVVYCTYIIIVVFNTYNLGS
jgi:hypothetical protein